MVFHLGKLPVELDLAEMQREPPVYTSCVSASNGLPVLQFWRSSRTGHYFFRYSEGVTYVFDGSGCRLWALRDEGVSEDLLSAFLLGQVFGFLLHLRGYVCLHASAVAIDGRAVLFAGSHGSGKSSTAAAFAERGYPVLSDDVAPIRMDRQGQLLVSPGIPRVCLWPQSTEFLYGHDAAERLPRLLEQEEKRLVRLDGPRGKHRQEPALLGAVYLLAPRSGSSNAPRIERLETADHLIQLLPNGFASGALDSEQRSREFQIQGEISRSVPVQRLVPSSDPAKVGQLCDLVSTDVHAMNFLLPTPVR